MCAGLKDFQSIFVEASFIMLHHMAGISSTMFRGWQGSFV
jgi:hypothetical protein